MGASKIPEDVEKQAEDGRRELEPMSPDLAKIFNAPQERRTFLQEDKKSSKSASPISQLKKVFRIRGDRAEIRLRLEVLTDLASTLERTLPGIRDRIWQEVRSIRSTYKGKKFQIAHLDELLERLERYRSN